MKHDVQDCIGSRLRGLSRQVDTIFRRHLEGSGVTEHQLSILFASYKMGETEQNEIGRILHLERSSLSRNLTRLIDQGFVIKHGPVNRPLISLTTEGLKKVEQILPAWNDAMDEIRAIIDEQAYQGFTRFENALKGKR